MIDDTALIVKKSKGVDRYRGDIIEDIMSATELALILEPLNETDIDIMQAVYVDGFNISISHAMSRLNVVEERIREAEQRTRKYFSAIYRGSSQAAIMEAEMKKQQQQQQKQKCELLITV